MSPGIALPAQSIDKLVTIGSAFTTGLVEAAAYRAHPTAGTIATFGGGIGGLLFAMTAKGRWAEVAAGVASSSAGSLGHFAIKALWPGRRALGAGGNGRKAIGRNSPRELVGAGNPGNPGNVAQEIMNEELLV